MKNKVRYYRQEQKITQEQMGILLGITRQTVSALEQGRYDPPITMAGKLAIILEQPLEELFDFTTVSITLNMEDEKALLSKHASEGILKIPINKETQSPQ